MSNESGRSVESILNSIKEVVTEATLFNTNEEIFNKLDESISDLKKRDGYMSNAEYLANDINQLKESVREKIEDVFNLFRDSILAFIKDLMEDIRVKLIINHDMVMMYS